MQAGVIAVRGTWPNAAAVENAAAAHGEPAEVVEVRDGNRP